MLVIRLCRTGCKNNPRYRINVADQKKPATGKFIETLGFYNPFDKEKGLTLNKENYDSWVKKGAQPTKRVQSLYKKVN